MGGAYVGFAKAHPGMFVLMFRSERLDLSRPALRAAVDASARVLAGTVGARREEQVAQTLTEAREALKNAKEVLGQDSPLQRDLGSTLLQVSRAAKSINALVDYLERHPESLLRGKPGDSP